MFYFKMSIPVPIDEVEKVREDTSFVYYKVTPNMRDYIPEKCLGREDSKYVFKTRKNVTVEIGLAKFYLVKKRDDKWCEYIMYFSKMI